MKSEPQKEHTWLQKLLGEWTFEADAPPNPDGSSNHSSGSESVRSLGGLWIVAEGQGEMPGGGLASNIMSLGYDPLQKRYVGTWIGCMFSHLWVYKGSMTPAGALQLNTEGPDMTDPLKMANYRDVIEFQSDNRRTLTSHVQGADGKWQQFMTAVYTRKR
jgi:hypothetical protein